MSRSLSLCVFLLSFSAGAGAQHEPLRFQHFGVDQGLTVTTAFSIVQDDNGFLWISTIDGLHRYDGYKFVTYKNNFNDSLSLSDNTLSTIYKDKHGNFWIGTYNEGVNCFDPRTGHSKHYDAKPGNPNRLSNGRVWCVCEERDGKIWVGTDQGLNLLDPASGKVTRFFHDEKDPASISSNRILCLSSDKKGYTWVGTDHGLNRAAYSEDGKIIFDQYFADPGNEHAISSNIVLSVSNDPHGNGIWVGTVDGLNRGEEVPGTHKNRPYSFITYRFGSGVADKTTQANSVYSYLNSYGENSVRSTWQRSENELWVATDKGLKILNPSNGTFTAWHSDATDPQSLSAELCLCFCPDRSGNVWIGTMVGGINKVDLKPKKFPLIQTEFGNPYNLSSNNIRAVFVDSANILWVGTLGGGLNRMNPLSGKFEKVVHKSNDPSLNFDPENVWAISEDRFHNLWIGTSTGLCRMDRAGDKFTVFTTDASDPRSISNNIIRCILSDHSGNLWIATEGGLDLFDGKNHFTRFIHNATDPSSLSNNTVWTLREIGGKIWIGTDDGLNCADVTPLGQEQAGAIVFKHYYAGDGKKNLSNKSVRSIYEDERGSMWVGTNNGLNCFNETTGEFQRYGEAEGLPNSFIYAVLGDHQHHLWISTNFGISRFDLQSKKFRNYDKLDGLQNNEFNTGGYFLAKNGELFFGGPDGLNHFFPSKVSDNLVPPPVVITSIKLFGEEMKRTTEASEVKNITLRYDENVIAFEFASLDLTQPEKNQYAYQLKGFDKEVIRSGNRRFVSYTNLDPGEYTFTVYGSNNDGTWNLTGTGIHITIVPPFWKTWWFYTACLGLVVLTTYSFIRIRINRLRRTQVLLEEQVNIKTRELREEKETVETQKKVIEKKNLNITSSIRYAKRIQDSILPMKEKLNELLPESFIFFRPKDIVSGDFYWFTRSGSGAHERILVAAVDCTGHGVPGAFMSLIGNNLLNNIVNIRKVTDPKTILEQLHKGVVLSLKKDEQESGTVDGMDITLCTLDPATRTLEFSSTGRPLILIKGNELRKLKVGNHPVGFVGTRDPVFEKQTVQLAAGDSIYIFTDGYCDQFGGADDDKFMEVNFEKLLLRVKDKKMEEQAALLGEAIENWKGDAAQLDDMLVIGMRV